MKVLLLGSGGLCIGQAGEFDYSGTQAIKALREEGIEVIVVNPNIATVQTNPIEGTSVYLYPVEAGWVEKIIEQEKPDALIAGFGGQTALNCAVELEARGVLEKHEIRNLGTPISTLRLTEDRNAFAKKMRELDLPVPPSRSVSSLEEARAAAESLGFPLIIRAAYALGGLGSGFASNHQELQTIVEAALNVSPQVQIEKSLRGWKELEYEVMRDGQGNAITICNMENIDPLGIHTGDSIVIAPSQTLSDEDYQLLRNAAVKIVNAIGIVGECNVQFALSPDSTEFYVIEVNARLSRSSALASKATGYPIAYIAAKVVLGFDLLELKNPVTGITCALFEPALDYVTVKIPRWDLVKFKGASRHLGSAMKSVGEVMGIGRTFQEAVQKACRMVTEDPEGLSRVWPERTAEEVLGELSKATDMRLFYLMHAFRIGVDIERVNALTGIDKWFLAELRELARVEAAIVSRTGALSEVTAEEWRLWKVFGFGDEQIAALRERRDPYAREQRSLEIRKERLRKGVHPVVKKIDTTAGEYPSPSNYLYLSYSGEFSDPKPPTGKEKSAIILGAGAYRVGTSVEFDWCAVAASQKLQELGWRSIIINCNPETVSTDFNCSDRLYFEELTLERILDIVEVENPNGVIASMGGQLPNRLMKPLHRAGVNLLGHEAEAVDQAESRHRFSRLLDELDIDQPRWTSATSEKQVADFISLVGFPVLVRPSYVLSGAAMCVAYNDDSLKTALELASDISPEHPVVITEFIKGAREIEVDGVARDGEVLASIVSEHVENAGVHSGDATLVLPAQKLYVETVRRVQRGAKAIAKSLKLNGPFNIQFLALTNQVKVIECNARAARSFPFISKVTGLNLAELATAVCAGEPVEPQNLDSDALSFVGVKAAMFSFPRLDGADPVLGVEMSSTGEVGCLAETFDEALLLALQASSTKIPRKAVLVSAGSEAEKIKFLPAAHILMERGLKLYATEGTAKFLARHNIPVEALAWPGQAKKDVLHAIKEGWVDLVVNIPKNEETQELLFDSTIRQAAIRNGISLFTNMEKLTAFAGAIVRYPQLEKTHRPLRLPPFRKVARPSTSHC